MSKEEDIKVFNSLGELMADLNTVMRDEELNKAFDGDFGEVFFDHTPTAEDIFLIKLNLVAQAQDAKTKRIDRKAIFEWLKKHNDFNELGIERSGCGLILTIRDYKALKKMLREE